MQSNLLHVVAVYSNPIRWDSRRKVHAEFEQHMLDSGVQLTTVECAYGERPFELEPHPEINRVQVRSSTLVWNKENLINVGIARLPHDWKYVAWIDADITFRAPKWASDTVHALQHYQLVQPWADAYDLGPNEDHMQTHKSFLRLWYQGQPIAPDAPLKNDGKRGPFWKHDGGPYEYAHTGYAWAARREAIEKLGGLFEISALGEGDNVMAKALVGRCESAVPSWIHPGYLAHLHRWQNRALQHVHFRLGYVPGTIEHSWHGRKQDRGYVNRWDILKRHGFNPDTDLKKNTYGVIELAGNKPMLSHDIDKYFRQRNEDSNTL